MPAPTKGTLNFLRTTRIDTRDSFQYKFPSTHPVPNNYPSPGKFPLDELPIKGKFSPLGTRNNRTICIFEPFKATVPFQLVISSLGLRQREPTLVRVNMFPFNQAYRRREPSPVRPLCSFNRKLMKGTTDSAGKFEERKEITQGSSFSVSTT